MKRFVLPWASPV